MKIRFISTLALGTALIGQALAGTIFAAGTDIDSTEAGWLASRGNTVTLGSTDLTGSDFTHSAYTGIWLGWNTTFTGLAGASSDIMTFVSNGGNLFFETGYSNLDDLGLTGFTHDRVDADDIHIVDGSNGLFDGVTDADLSGWGNSYHDLFTLNAGSQFHGLSDNGNAGEWTTVVLNYGLGHIVLTGQDASYHMKNGSGDTGALSSKMTLVTNGLNLTTGRLSSVPGPAAALPFLAGFLRRRRSSRA